MKFEREIETNGKGLWSRTATKVRTLRLKLNRFDDSFGELRIGELRVFFDRTTWNVNNDGLIYTDPLFIKQLRSHLNDAGFDEREVDYSEQGMQGNNYVSLDVGKNFIRDWNELEVEV